MDRVKGKVAFVTGAARGQGRAHAVRLAEEGADIIAVDLCAPVPGVVYPAATADDLAETVRQVKSLGARVVARQVDTRDRDEITEVLDAGVRELGRLDIVVANAGICIISAWDDITPEAWQTTIDINLTGTWNTVHLAAPHLVTSGGGSIILTSSVAGLKALPFMIPYAASKHGVVGLMRGFAAELAASSIRVNSVHPTGVDTPMGAGGTGLAPLLETNPVLQGMFTNMLPITITEPVDISNAVLFLASDESRYVTSSAMTVDAGNTQY